ncbi:peptidase [Gammaproteobacteria bacterium 42_54_T18]|nr:peptidase [Gammaproteobacteria bacterium 42_54_T18]
MEQAIGVTSIRMFANAIDISEGALRKYLKGISLPQIDKAMLIAQEAGVSLNWLITGEAPKYIGNQNKPISDSSYGCATVTVEEFNEEYALIPGYHISVSTGHGALNSEAEVKRQLAFRTKWLRFRKLNACDLAVVFAQGDSMEPTINNGNTILVNIEDKQLKDGSIFVLRFGEELYAKRLQKRFDGSVCLISDNKEYDEQIVKPDELEQLEIIGKVVWIGKDLY